MAFCSNCGAQLVNGAAFCPNCGTAIGTAAPAPQAAYQPVYQSAAMNSVQQATQVRSDSLNELERMVQYFGKKQSEYDQMDACNAAIPVARHFCAKAMLVWGIILAVIGSSVFASLANHGAGLIVGLIMMLGGAGLIVGCVFKNKKRKSDLAYMEQRVQELASELSAYYVAYGPCLIGMEYSNPRVLEAIRDTISTGRADTPKEAINVLLDDAHKENMEAMAQQQVENTAAAAAGAGTAAFFSAASFFL